MPKPIIAIVVPCYNEEDMLPETAKQLYGKISRLISDDVISAESKVVFVDDGSVDNTWAMIETFCTENPRNYAGIKLSKNRGHQNALLCGLHSVKGVVDAAISIDADLQDDVDVIDEMIEKYLAGHEIVYGVRSSRDTDAFYKRIPARTFYHLMRFLGVDMVFDSADFRLMGKKALGALAEYSEVNIFLRGIVPLLGYKTGMVYYSRKKRFAGTRKYTLRKLSQLALNGITSFSIKPMRLITLLGILLLIISILMIIYSIVSYFWWPTTIGWASLACSIWGIGGLILFSIGVTGEYIGKIYLEVKSRPRFHIEQCLYQKPEEV